MCNYFHCLSQILSFKQRGEILPFQNLNPWPTQSRIRVHMDPEVWEPCLIIYGMQSEFEGERWWSKHMKLIFVWFWVYFWGFWWGYEERLRKWFPNFGAFFFKKNVVISDWQDLRKFSIWVDFSTLQYTTYGQFWIVI